MDDKLQKLKDILVSMESVALGFSGGVDSTFLLKVASDTLGARVLAIIADSATMPRDEFEFAVSLAEQLGVSYTVIKSMEMSDPEFIKNNPDRCYWCKTGLFDKMREVADKKGMRYIADGSNVDDISDYRPGSRAAREAGVRSPLQEAGYTKEEIRQASRELNLSTWDKPSMACLSSRIPYGDEITAHKLIIVEKAEKLLSEMGFRQLRVRFHGTIARIEVPVEDFQRLIDTKARESLIGGFKSLGFKYITLDLSGYKTGSMNI